MMLRLTIWPVIAALVLATRVLGAVEANSVYNGPYQIYRCSQQDQTVQGLLAQTTSMLEAAIKDVSTGISSDFGYSAIFKHPTDVPYIKAVLQKIADGSPMPVQTNRLHASRSPILICVKPGGRDPTMAQFKSTCTGQGLPAVLIPDTPWVVLCPSFFKMKEAPEKIDCPTRNPRGMLFPKDALIANQMSALVRQLAHFYLGRDDLRPEISDLNQILSFPADVTRRNARSYEYYTASVQANCNSWPGGPHHRPGTG